MRKADATQRVAHRCTLTTTSGRATTRLHIYDYRKAIQQNGELMVSDFLELIDLDYAFQQTLDIYSEG